MNQNPFFMYPLGINRIFNSIEEINIEIKKINQKISNIERLLDSPLNNISPKKLSSNNINDYNKNYTNGHYII